MSSDSGINGLPAGQAVAATDVLPADQLVGTTFATKGVTAAQLKVFANSGGTPGTVITTLIDSGAAGLLQVKINGTLVVGINFNQIVPITDVSINLGSTSNRFTNVYTTVIDTGSGTLTLKAAGVTAATITGANIATAGTLQIGSRPAFVAGDKYLIVDASGNIHVSATGPGS